MPISRSLRHPGRTFLHQHLFDLSILVAAVAERRVGPLRTVPAALSPACTGLLPALLMGTHFSLLLLFRLLPRGRGWKPSVNVEDPWLPLFLVAVCCPDLLALSMGKLGYVSA